MSPVQRANLIEHLALEDHELEAYLDSRSPQDFLYFPSFGAAYVAYVRKLRDMGVDTKIDLLADDAPEMGVTYVRKDPEFHPLPSGHIDCRLTMTLPVNQARWLSGLIHRLPDMYPNSKEKQDIGWHVAQRLLDVMKLDTKRHGGIGGAMSKEDFNDFRSTTAPASPTGGPLG
jgi:hypothetical protein